jgi:hypothetical protein
MPSRAEIEAAVAAECERCAVIADSMNSVSNIGDRIRYGLGHEASGRAKREAVERHRADDFLRC